MTEKTLTVRTEIALRYSDSDAMGVVWHGNYIQYFEDGREAFGEKYGLKYLDVYDNDFVTPLINVNCEYLKPLKYGDKAIIETRYVDSQAAKIIFEYTIFRASDNEVAAKGRSIQVFLTTKGVLHITIPPFFAKWKKKWGL